MTVIAATMMHHVIKGMLSAAIISRIRVENSFLILVYFVDTFDSYVKTVIMTGLFMKVGYDFVKYL